MVTENIPEEEVVEAAEAPEQVETPEQEEKPRKKSLFSRKKKAEPEEAEPEETVQYACFVHGPLPDGETACECGQRCLPVAGD